MFLSLYPLSSLLSLLSSPFCSLFHQFISPFSLLFLFCFHFLLFPLNVLMCCSVTVMVSKPSKTKTNTMELGKMIWYVCTSFPMFRNLLIFTLSRAHSHPRSASSPLIRHIQQTGHGVYMSHDGSCFEGTWKNGKKKGQGTLFLPNGDRLEGEWKDDEVIKAHYYKGTTHGLPKYVISQ